MTFPLLVVSATAIAAGTVGVTIRASRRRWLLPISAIVGTAALLLVHGPAYFDYFADDSYITLRYSRHLADGLGPNWNSDGRVEGYTSFLWMALLAGVGKLGVDLVDAARVMGAIALLVTLFFIYRVWRLWAEEAPASGLNSPVLLAAVLLALALTDGVAFWGFSGMETAPFMALLTISAYLYFRERRGSRLPLSAVALAAAVMTRPEGLIAVAVTGAFYVADAARAPSRRPALTRTLVWGGVFALLYGSYFIWRYTYYDYLLPNTYYAKVSLNIATVDRGLNYLADSGLQYHLLTLLTGTILLAFTSRVGRDAVYIVALAALMTASIVVEGGGDVHGRFLVPVLPLLLLGGLAGFATFLKRAALSPAQAATVTVLALGLGGLSLLSNSYDPLLAFGRKGIEERSMLGSWLNEHTPPHYTIADFMVGAISYHASDRDFLDLLGLNDVVIGHTEIPDMGSGVAGHEKYNPDYVFDVVRPEIIVVGQVHPNPLPKAQLRRFVQASSLFKASTAILSDPRLWEDYDVRAVNLDGRWFHFLQRNDTISELRGAWAESSGVVSGVPVGR